MNVTVDDLYKEIGTMTVTLRVREKQVSEYEAQARELRAHIVALEAELATYTGTPAPTEEGVADGR